MNFINFESAKDKEKARQDLRYAREQLLKKAQENAEYRTQKEIQKKLRGDTSWLLPSISKKLKKSRNKTSKKSRKPKCNKKRKRLSASESDSSVGETRKKKKKKRRHSTSSSNSSSSLSSCSKDEWIEKQTTPKENLLRDDWMVEGSLKLKTYCKDDARIEKKTQQIVEIVSYDPKTSFRELNPYWRLGNGSGVPSFQKPRDYDGNESEKKVNSSSSLFKGENYKSLGSGSWRKKLKDIKKPSTSTKSANNKEISNKSSTEKKSSESDDNTDYKEILNKNKFLTDQQMNELGAKIIKAELMGNNEMASDLKVKLEDARKSRNQIKENKNILFKNNKKDKCDDEHVLLTTTDSKGVTRPIIERSRFDSYDPYRKHGQKTKNVDTHSTKGKRLRYFPDDDKYDIKQMFEHEKYSDAATSDRQFAEIAGKHKNLNDDLEDLFEDKIRKRLSDHDEAEKEKKKAIQDYESFSRTLENCDKCFESIKMEKQLMVSMGSKCYVALPWHESLTSLGHCLIVPMQHISCSTQLDEDVWSEITDYRKAITNMFATKKMDVLFFETARYLNRRRHMAIHCIASSKFEMAQFYFKKAIQESEFEWSTNKQLITLKEKSLRRSIPKGLPYFWVNFGMDVGFAHVIENQQNFPSNFAEEIIGNILQLNPNVWRRPRKEPNPIQKVKQFATMFKPFDIRN